MLSSTDVQLALDIDVAGDGVPDLRPNWNVAPTQLVPVVLDRPARPGDRSLKSAETLAAPTPEERAAIDAVDPANPEAPGAPVRALELAHWGFIPPWAKDPSMGSRMINARSETVAEKRSFAPGFSKRRCIVPATGYFEWKKEGTAKRPFFIQRKDSDPLFLAGIYGWWQTPDAEWLLTATILTRAAVGDMAEIHDRSPVILERAEVDTWLDPSFTEPAAVLALIERPNAELGAYEVRKEVGNVRNNSPANLDPVEGGETV